MIAWLVAGMFAAALGGPGALAAPPANDACTGALAVAPGAPGTSTSNLEATLSADDPDLSCAMGPGFGSVFFTFTATATSARISTDLASAGPDSDFAVYAVDQGDQCDTAAWTEKGCAEDDAVTLDGNTSACIEGLTVNQTYKIMLKSFTAASRGDYTIQIDSPCEGGPSAVCGDGVVEGAEQCDDGNVVDGDGCSAICELEGVLDIEGPVVTAPADINVGTDLGLITAVVDFDPATATDNVGVVSLTQTAGPASGSAFPIGTTVVTWTATDAAGNQGSDSTDITVTDNEPPVLTVTVPDVNPVVATSAAGAVVSFAFATATDNSGIVTVTQITEPLSGETFPIGNTTVTFRAVDPSGNYVEASFTVTVIYLFGEFLPPLEDGKIYKTNRTLPVKFRITFAGGEPAEEVTVEIEVAMIGEGGGAGDPIDLSTNETADTGSVFRFFDGLYIYNLSTRGFAPGLYRITAILSNGQAPSIDIELR